ncbi:MAG TPA: alpha/beta fold hydrolase [Candidatus Paceibacterota bacterium]|nr:alpha/beta fold hydrolase [Verrucomicrobiota bacterium]HSA09124.1 alpha/beta fold hydrolase [Candidatus Paceibacterota bacterium]
MTTRQAYAQVQASALRTGGPSADTVSILHRYDLDRLAPRQPDAAVHQLYQKALATGDRDLLFALAELSYAAGDHIRRSVKPWDPREARDYYLGAAVYAWLFLFGDGEDAPPGPFDRRFRAACDFYNYGLGLALTGPRSTNAVVRLENARRRLPMGEIELRLRQDELALQLHQCEEILLADQFRVHGLSVRNREPGVGAPLIAVLPTDPALGMRRAVPATVLLRLQGTLADFAASRGAAALELYSPFEDTNVTIGQAKVPLETDLTTYRAYTLNQSTIWKLGKLDFLAPAKRSPSQLILNQPYESGRIPVVLVHGTFSSPVTWAEMGNTLIADPVLRQRYQFWTFKYGSGNPLVRSIADLRAALTAEAQRLDPQGTNTALRQMVVIGHSQGGLLTKCAAVDTGDRLWHVLSTNRLEDLKTSDAQRAELRSLFFLEPLPFVRRLVFIATPHRGSYLSGGLARRLARRLVTLPGTLASRGKELLLLAKGSDAGNFAGDKLPTSLDGMSPKNPGLLVLAEIPVVPSVKAHSIIPVLGEGDYRQGRDGVVAYQSAHVDYVESEFVVRSKHSCLNQPATIEEVRRILHEHLKELPPKTAQADLPVSLKLAAHQ